MAGFCFVESIALLNILEKKVRGRCGVSNLCSSPNNLYSSPKIVYVCCSPNIFVTNNETGVQFDYFYVMRKRGLSMEFSSENLNKKGLLGDLCVEWRMCYCSLKKNFYEDGQPTLWMFLLKGRILIYNVCYCRDPQSSILPFNFEISSQQSTDFCCHCYQENN